MKSTLDFHEIMIVTMLDMMIHLHVFHRTEYPSTHKDVTPQTKMSSTCLRELGQLETSTEKKAQW